MRKITIHLVKMLLCGLMLGHIVAHLLYLAPNNPATPIYKPITDRYMNSFFTQNWHLFAPEPATSSLRLTYRCNPYEDWKSPLEELLKQHKALPFTAKGKQAYVIQHLAREIFNGKLKNKEDHEIYELTLLQRYLQDHCGHSSAAEAEVQRTFTQDYSKRTLQDKGASQSFKFKLQKGTLAWN